MSDPRKDERERVQTMQRAPLTAAQELERIKLGLSPVDDALPLAQAVRQKEETQRAAAAFAKRTRRRNP